MKSKLKPLTRIKRVLKFYELRGVNKEKINTLYFKILTNFNKMQ
jgi:hypothetical protein